MLSLISQTEGKVALIACMTFEIMRASKITFKSQMTLGHELNYCRTRADYKQRI